MKKLVFFGFILNNILTTAQQTYWQQQVNYTIDVTLNDLEHTLDGFLKLQYINNSPDSISFIWFHLWPNAFKNDRTAFSEQLIQNGRTDFYFSDQEQKGYINRLDFRIGNATLKIEDHPQFIDVIKVTMPKPILAGEQVEISTPFHVKLPHNFSRGGHIGQSYQITQWYPKPAVYDRKGWHPIPYLDQGEFYSEFGNFDVRITIPKNYIVAATGELQNENEKRWLRSRESGVGSPSAPASGGLPQALHESEVGETKTIQYIQNNVHDFAWFADKRFIVKHDTVQFVSGRIIDAWSFSLPEGKFWENSIRNIKDAIHFRSSVIGEYPYNIVSAVEGPGDNAGGMEYPTITLISGMDSEKMFDLTLEHEIGHNWFYGILASDERMHPWMDEGMNTYYDNRYLIMKYGTTSLDLLGITNEKKIHSKLPEDEFDFLLNWLTVIKKDQPINTSSEEFTSINYNLITYIKVAKWMKQLEDSLGAATFDSCMREYFRSWKFKHPYPEDFRHIIETISGKNLDDQFELLDRKGFLAPPVEAKKIKPTFLFSFRGSDSISYINILPAIGYNKYDKLMLGTVVHNYGPPPNKFRFIIAPLFATGSKRLNGIGKVSYTIRPENYFNKIEFGFSGSTFSPMSGNDSNNTKLFGRFYKIVPTLHLTFRNKTARSTLEKWIEWKTYFIGEKGFEFKMKSTDSSFYPTEGKVQNRYLNQFTFNIADYRVLYPYDLQLQVQQSTNFFRVNATANYFFNYSEGGGMNVRFFAAKFGHIGTGRENDLDMERFMPTLLGNTGTEDYTYSNYFMGRSSTIASNDKGFSAQQIMVRDGGLKIRMDYFTFLQGRSDNWVSALNFSSTLPKKLFPIKVPLKAFFDIGTYAEAWKKEAETSRFLYVAGLQLSLFNGIVNLYAPLIYSKEFRDNLKTQPEINTFGKRLTFSIDIHRFNLRRLAGNQIPL